MPYVYACHRIDDYERWERHHEENGEARAAHGSLGSEAFRVRNDPTEVVVLIEIAEGRLEETLDYYDSEAFRETLEAAGVREVVEAEVLEKVHEQDA
ncbi:cyclase [Natrialbaceae archaeon GCM10025810]|uniref:cyclase n=1 Tax=Halovalidus salilacus TaxID=3075124 RepID=UPI003621A394